MADLFDIAIARKLSDGGGGGGSSDFSTATVTMTKTYEGTFESYMAAIGTTEEDWDSVSIGGIEDGTFILPLYKGYNYIIVTNMPDLPTISVTGDIQWDLENGIFSVAGDGTITIS